ncbi:MAG: urease accessory protein UreF [Tateyamaria sp.]
MAGRILTITAIPPMSTPIDPRLLTLTHWLSPAFPIGAFAYSHGIETAIHEGWIANAGELEDWLRDCLSQGTGRSDAIWLRLAYAADDPCEIDAKARAFANSRERLREAERQGAAFARLVNDILDLRLPDLLLPVAVGQAARCARLDLEGTVALYLQSFVANLVSAAVRLSPIGQTAGQRVIARLQDFCVEVTRSTATASADDVFGNAFLSDVAAMRHETLEPRLFQS